MRCLFDGLGTHMFDVSSPKERSIVRGDAEDKMQSTAVFIPPIPPRENYVQSPPTHKKATTYNPSTHRSVPIPQVRYFVNNVVDIIFSLWNRVQKNTSECDWSTSKTSVSDWSCAFYVPAQ